MNYVIRTLGCKVNQYETQAIETLLAERGHTAVEQNADAVIVNTCAVTAESARKSRQMIRRMMLEHPSALVAVCGCYSQVSTDEAAGLGADLVFGSGERLALIEALEAAYHSKAGHGKGRAHIAVDDPFSRRNFEILPAGSVSGRTRAMLKIEDGCDNFCSYCVIPYARGHVRSLPPNIASEQAAALAMEGYRELVITGIEISSYGKDLKECRRRLSLIDVVENIAAAAPQVRLRLGSLEPTIVTEDFCRRLAALDNLCPHFHLSLQSGCDRTLATMRRRYDTSGFLMAVDLLRKFFPDCALTADLITGFPGETDKDHEETLSFLRRCGFASMHIFPYSERPGTPAAVMSDRIPKAIRAQRAHEAQQVSEEMELEYLHGCVGKTLSVLFETEEDGQSIGHAANYCTVAVEGTQLRGIVSYVKITGLSGKILVGKRV